MNAAEMYEGKRGMNMTVGQGVPSEPRRVEESRVEGSKGRRVEGSKSFLTTDHRNAKRTTALANFTLLTSHL